MNPTVAVVIPSLSGGWIEIGRPTPAALLDVWQRKHLYDPASDLGRAIEDGDLVSAVSVHVPDSSFGTPIAWTYETQRRFTLFLGSIARMTFRFPQDATFIDPVGRLTIDAEAYRRASEPPHRQVHVRFRIRVHSLLRDGPFEAELDLHQGALGGVVGSCCAVFPALGADEFRVALD